MLILLFPLPTGDITIITIAPHLLSFIGDMGTHG